MVERATEAFELKLALPGALAPNRPPIRAEAEIPMPNGTVLRIWRKQFLKSVPGERKTGEGGRAHLIDGHDNGLGGQRELPKPPSSKSNNLKSPPIYFKSDQSQISSPHCKKNRDVCVQTRGRLLTILYRRAGFPGWPAT